LPVSLSNCVCLSECACWWCRVMSISSVVMVYCHCVVLWLSGGTVGVFVQWSMCSTMK
jgi:hypothetical protein